MRALENEGRLGAFRVLEGPQAALDPQAGWSFCFERSPKLLGEGGTYMLGATFGQPVMGDDNTTTLSPGVVIWTGDDNASAFMAPVGGTLEWCPDPTLCTPTRGVLRLTPRPSGEGGEAGEDPLPARTDLVAQRIYFEGMELASVEEAIQQLADERDQNATTLFEGGSFGVEPGDRLGQAARVEPEDFIEVPDPSGGDAITLTRRLFLTVMAAEHPAYVDPYLFFPEDVDGIILSPEHQSVLGDVTPPDLSGWDISLYPHSDDQSVAPLEPRDQNETVPHYDVEAGQYLDLAVLARDLGAGACSADGCAPSANLLGVKSITYYITDEDETAGPLIGPVTVDLRCLDADRFDQTEPTSGIYRPDAPNSADGFLYDVTAMRARSDGCLSYESGFEGLDAQSSQDLALDTGLLTPETTYTLVVVTTDYGGNESGSTSDTEGPSFGAGLPSGPRGARVNLNVVWPLFMPRIDLIGDTEIDAGEAPIHVETTITTAFDGHELTFAWDILQAPETIDILGPAGTGSAIYIETDNTHAGTWVFQITVVDEREEQPGQPPVIWTNSAEYTVLVDGPPEAIITGPVSAGNLLPVSLDGSGSSDSDSPCTADEDYCHHTLDARPVVLVNGQALQYTWYLASSPPDVSGNYPPGRSRVDAAFGAPAHEASLDVGPLAIGDWTFELDVVDEEGNTDTATWQVTVVDDHQQALARVSYFECYPVSSTGVALDHIVIDGSLSLDPDNPHTGQPLPGITDYTWEVVAPAGCVGPPTAPSGATDVNFPLYGHEGVVPTTCWGEWWVRLTVTDDDTPDTTGVADATFEIAWIERA